LEHVISAEQEHLGGGVSDAKALGVKNETDSPKKLKLLLLASVDVN
jgi:hypothetical protein